MKLIDAMQINKQPGAGADGVRVGLACAFSPLHLLTFVTAHLRSRLDMRGVKMEEGLFGDLVGTLDRMIKNRLDAMVVLIEWPDLDPRLSLRSSSDWCHESITDVLTAARSQAQRLAVALARSQTRTVVSLPTLPLPPMAPTAAWQASGLQLQLDLVRANLAVKLSESPYIRLVSDHEIANRSPMATRFDVRGELGVGFPYTLGHANALSELLATNLFPPVRKKGLIVDLDDTLWHGTVGEVGPQGVLWDLDAKAQGHALLQKLLTSLATSGVMVGVASKNDPAIIKQTFAEREDLIAKTSHIHPFEVNWGQKSKSVERILRSWNVSADSIIFVDDSPMELAEVKTAFPAIECLIFPAKDEVALYELILKLRDAFGTSTVREEDRLRLASIRQGDMFREQTAQMSGETVDAFLRELEARVTLIDGVSARDQRAFELTNKTNQFNLNGRRYLETEWERLLDRPGAVLLVADYQDKFGLLGKIAVLAGCINGKELVVNSWVMSCRAFSRRVEHAMLDFLMKKLGVNAIVLEYAPTAKNGPIQEFLESITGSLPSAGCIRLTPQTFAANCPALFHEIKEVAR